MVLEAQAQSAYFDRQYHVMVKIGSAQLIKKITAKKVTLSGLVLGSDGFSLVSRLDVVIDADKINLGRLSNCGSVLLFGLKKVTDDEYSANKIFSLSSDQSPLLKVGRAYARSVRGKISLLAEESLSKGIFLRDIDLSQFIQIRDSIEKIMSDQSEFIDQNLLNINCNAYREWYRSVKNKQSQGAQNPIAMMAAMPVENLVEQQEMPHLCNEPDSFLSGFLLLWRTNDGEYSGEISYISDVAVTDEVLNSIMLDLKKNSVELKKIYTCLKSGKKIDVFISKIYSLPLLPSLIRKIKNIKIGYVNKNINLRTPEEIVLESIFSDSGNWVKVIFGIHQYIHPEFPEKDWDFIRYGLTLRASEFRETIFEDDLKKDVIFYDLKGVFLSGKPEKIRQ